MSQNAIRMTAAGAGVVVLFAACGCESRVAEPEPEPRKPDILLISIDTLRADGVSAHGGGPVTTPFIDELAREGVRFDRGYSTSSWTTPAVVSMLTSSYPTRHGVGQTPVKPGQWETIPGDLPSLAESLRQGGYRTYGLTANFGLPVERGFGRGFDEYRCIGAQDLDVFRTELEPTLPRLAEDEPWFLWLHMFDPHAPYTPRERWLGDYWGADRERDRDLDNLEAGTLRKNARQYSDEQMAYLRAQYHSEIRDVDAFLQELFERVPRARDALVVFTADHGEEFMEHGGMLHGHTLYEELIRVPFIIRLPDRSLAGTTVDKPVSLVDVLPTILALVGLEPPPNVSGVDLLDADGIYVPESRVIFAELLRGDTGLRAVIDDRYKLVANPYKAGRSVLTDLHSDPAEATNLLEVQPEQVAAMQHVLDGFVLAASSQRTQHGLADLTPEQLQALRSLGYVR